MFSPRNDDHLKDIIQKYKDDPSREFEVRFYINDKTDMERVYKSLLERASSVKIEQILNTITDVGKNITDRKEIWFVNGKKQKEANLRKHKEMFLKTRGIVEIQAAVSSETDIPPFSTSLAKFIRLKYRCSLAFDKPLSIWRADFTVVRTIGKTQFANILQLKDAFFGKNVDPKKFSDLFIDDVAEKAPKSTA